MKVKGEKKEKKKSLRGLQWKINLKFLHSTCSVEMGKNSSGFLHPRN